MGVVYGLWCTTHGEDTSMMHIVGLLLLPCLLFVPSCHSSQIFVSPYNFSLNSDTHQLHTTWEVKGSSITFICAFAKVSMMELSFSGKSKELSSGTSWAVNCEEGEQGDKMVIEVDVTKFRVQPFRSYKVCISLEDYITDSYLDEVCTHLFSFEKYVPYVPEEEVGEYLMREESETEKEVKTKLEDIEHFVRDDFKSSFVNLADRTELELSLKILDELKFEMEHSRSGRISFSHVLMLGTILAIIGS